MRRKALPFVMLTALGGCLGMNEPNYEPEPPTARPVRASWRTSDGVSAGTDAVYARQSAVNVASAAKVMTPGRPTGTETTPVTQPPLAEGEAFDTTLVKATFTKAPRAGAGAEAKATHPEATSAEAPKSAAGTAAMCKSGLETCAVGAASVCSGANPSALRLVNSRRIAFHYEVKDSAAGPVNVEVWGTQDLKSWKKYEAVAVKGKSHVIEVREEGLYGFTLLARGPRGGSKDRPLPGEAPQVWVAVDFTRPVVQFIGAELNILAPVPTLVVRWTASDKNLGPRPVSIFYADQGEGPWTLLAANIENSGRYEWALPATLPQSLYLRVQTADLMGNVGMAQTPNLMLNMRSATVAANPVRKPEPCHEVIAAVHEPEQPHPLPHSGSPAQPRLLALPPTPALDLTHVPAAPALPDAPPAEIHIVGVEGDKSN
jgi:hypothetical protein